MVIAKTGFVVDDSEKRPERGGQEMQKINLRIEGEIPVYRIWEC